MNHLLSGRVAERPFAKVVYALAAHAFTGALILESGSRRRVLWFDEGSIVDAESDEELLGGDPLATVTHRALSLFGVPDGDYHADAQTHGRAAFALDARWLIYKGLRAHYDDRRLDRELAPLAGHAVRMGAAAEATLQAYGFGDEERIILGYLQKGYWELPDLIEATISAPRGTVMSVVYALIATDALEIQKAEAVPRLRKRAKNPTQQLSSSGVPRMADDPPSAPITVPAGTPPKPLQSAAAAPSTPPVAQSTPPVATQTPLNLPPPGAFVQRISTGGPLPPPRPAPTIPPHAMAVPQVAPPPKSVAAPPKPAVAPPARPAAPSGSPQIRDQIIKKFASIEQGADHYVVLEIARDATKDQIKNAYFQHAKTYHPDRLPLLKLEDLRPQVERIFARLSEAFAVLGDDARRRDYGNVLAQGGEKAIKQREDAETAAALKILSAEEHFRLGEMAMRRNLWPQAVDEFKKALDANPEEPEHHALYAWVLWASAADKNVVATDVKKKLQTAIDMSPKCVPAHYYLAMVSNQLGDVDRAYSLFRRVLEIRPGHVDAERELRVLEMRRNKAKKK